MIVYNYVDQNTNEVVATTVSRQFGYAWMAIMAFSIALVFGLIAWAMIFTDASGLWVDHNLTIGQVIVKFFATLKPIRFYFDMHCLWWVMISLSTIASGVRILTWGYYGEHPVRAICVLQKNPKED